MTKFEELYAINVNDKVEQKDKLTYLTWTYAWAEIKKRCPDANYEIIMFDGKPYLEDPNLGYMCMVNVTVDGETHEMWLPVMDSSNNAMKSEPYEYQVKNKNFKYAKWDEAKKGYFDSYGNPQSEYITKRVDAATMFDINKTIMRCLVKAIAMFGLGLYIYAGEDLPEVPTMTDKTKIEALAAKLKALKITQKDALTLLKKSDFEKLTIEEYTDFMALLEAYEHKQETIDGLCEAEKVTAEEIFKVINVKSVDEISLRGMNSLMDINTWQIIKGKIESARGK